ncbi:MAG: argininosuccinate lyase [Candidatus Gracilibacteria bacterium]|nr:argininosuccinate lyase [Candidatus Gracilibacteria bacterium]MDD5179319.1 argininosuccinate lyase [Candidatus Gracilibacteria bacterium]
MAKKIWQTGANLDPEVEAYTVGNDYLLDQRLLPYDIAASEAQARMLKKIEVITATELKSLEAALAEILAKWKQGKFQIERNQEDGHTALEQFLTEKCGEAGKKIHTGRSRNDQALVMLRLFMKAEAIEMEKLVKGLISAFEAQAKRGKKIPLPGYTHTQKAMPTTVAIWLESFADALRDQLPFLAALRKLLNQNPLGSASGFGIPSFPLDRSFTTRELDFAKTQENPQYCGLSRGSFEYQFLATLSPIFLILSRFVNDLLLFTTQEFSYFSLPVNFTTGSSIMPQKRNYDLLEIMRANTNVFFARENEIRNILSSLISGYHRDLQLTKKSLIEGIDLAKATFSLATKIVKHLQPNEKRLKSAMSEDLFATEKVYELVKQGIPFREAYQQVKKEILG